MFRIEMLPAEQGDALFIEYGSASNPNRVLIDAGVRKTSASVKARIEHVPMKNRKRRFDLLIVTHESRGTCFPHIHRTGSAVRGT